jgi:integrase
MSIDADRGPPGRRRNRIPQQTGHRHPRRLPRLPAIRGHLIDSSRSGSASELGPGSRTPASTTCATRSHRLPSPLLAQGLPMIGKLLGHTQVQTTARYAHLAADPVKAAADHVSAAIAASVLGEGHEKAAVNE